MILGQLATENTTWAVGSDLLHKPKNAERTICNRMNTKRYGVFHGSYCQECLAAEPEPRYYLHIFLTSTRAWDSIMYPNGGHLKGDYPSLQEAIDGATDIVNSGGLRGNYDNGDADLFPASSIHHFEIRKR